MPKKRTFLATQIRSQSASMFFDIPIKRRYPAIVNIIMEKALDTTFDLIELALTVTTFCQSLPYIYIKMIT